MHRAWHNGEWKRIVLIGHTYLSSKPLRRHLVAYDSDGDLDSPLWSVAISNNDLPEDLLVDRNMTGDNFGIRCVQVDDYLPERSGDEILVIQQHFERSQVAVQIYTFDGKLQYQVWHDGNLGAGGMQWLRRPRVLILTGLNGEVLWSDREGYRDTQLFRHPAIVLGLRITPGIHREWIKTDDDFGTIEPEFYLCMLPLEGHARESDIAFFEVERAPTDREPDSNARINILFDRSEGYRTGFSFLINGQGVENPDYRMTETRFLNLPADEQTRLRTYKLEPLPGTTREARRRHAAPDSDRS